MNRLIRLKEQDRAHSQRNVRGLLQFTALERSLGVSMWMDSSCYCLICYSSKVAEMILNFSGLMHVFLNILRPEGERSVGHCMSLCPPTQGQTALRLKHNIVYERIDFLLIFLYQTGFKQIFTFFSPSPLMYLHSYQAWRICLLASQA